MTNSRRTILPTLVATLLLAGCGGDGDYANNPRPPAPINVTAAITERGITVSPQTFGAGQVVFIIANQTGEPRRVTLQTDELGGDEPGIKQTTSPINPAGTATLKVDMRQGSYSVSASGGDLEQAAIRVRGRRKSAQDQLLQP